MGETQSNSQVNSQEAAKEQGIEATLPSGRLSAEINELSRIVVDSAFKVHDSLGPGLLESVYQTCLAHELRMRKVSVLTEVVLPIVYEGLEINSGLRLDFLVEGKLIVEVKAVDSLQGIHEAQLFTYLRLSKLPL